MKSWTRHLFYRRESWRTTWTLRLTILFLAIVVIPATRRWWAPAIGHSLTCVEQIQPSDAFLVENFDPDYLVFEHTRTLQASGVATKAFIPVTKAGGSEETNLIEAGIANLMIKVAWLQDTEFIPIQVREPISLNAAIQIRDVLVRDKVRSVIVVSPAFRSRRSLLVYDSVLKPAGIAVRCAPVFGTTTADNWTEQWHGIQGVTEQFIKLLYYRFWVLRHRP